MASGYERILKQFTKNTNKGGKRWIDLTTLKFKHLRASKDTINKVKRKVTDQERKFAIHKTKKKKKWFVARIYKKTYKSIR